MLLRGRAAAAAARLASLRIIAARAGTRTISGGQIARSSVVAVDDEKYRPADIKSDGPLIKYGLKDWKLTVPVGLALAVPFLANEWYILSEETQLVAAFIAFGTSVYKFGGDAIARNFDERQEAIISEINRLEELELKLYKETIAAAELEKSIVEDLAFLDRKSSEIAEKLEVVLVGQEKHKIRDQYIRLLDSFVAQEKASKKEIIDIFLNETTVQVTKTFQSDAKLKKSAVDQVFALLKDPNAKQPDLVGEQFEKVGKKVWDEVTKKQTGTASPQTINQLSSELKALKSKQPWTETEVDNAIKIYYNAFKAGIQPSQLKA